MTEEPGSDPPGAKSPFNPDQSGAMTTVQAMALFTMVPEMAMAPGQLPAPTGPVSPVTVFISTAEDQLSLLAFGANAMLITGLFGAIAVSREYGHGTVVPTFLTTPRRTRAVLAQLTAVFVGGGALGLVGAGLILVTGAISIPAVDYEFLLSAGTVTRILAAAILAGGLGAVLGAGIGALVRNTGGAVVGAVLVLLILPPLAVQLASGAASWIPSTLVSVLSGVVDDPGVPAALLALAAWSLVPAVMGLAAVQKRDVV